MDFPYATLSLVASLTVASLWFIDSVVLWWRVRVYERLFRWGVLLLLLGSLFLPAFLLLAVQCRRRITPCPGGDIRR